MKNAGYLTCLKKESVDKKNHKQAISNSEIWAENTSKENYASL